MTLDAATTATWPAGGATLVWWVERGAERRTIGRQAVQILPDLATSTAFDGRSQDVKALADAKKALADYVAGGKLHVAEYEIGPRRMKFRDSEQIEKLISYYEREVSKENFAQAVLAGRAPGRVNIRM